MLKTPRAFLYSLQLSHAKTFFNSFARSFFDRFEVSAAIRLLSFSTSVGGAVLLYFHGPPQGPMVEVARLRPFSIRFQYVFKTFAAPLPEMRDWSSLSPTVCSSFSGVRRETFFNSFRGSVF